MVRKVKDPQFIAVINFDTGLGEMEPEHPEARKKRLARAWARRDRALRKNIADRLLLGSYEKSLRKAFQLANEQKLDKIDFDVVGIRAQKRVIWRMTLNNVDKIMHMFPVIGDAVNEVVTKSTRKFRKASIPPMFVDEYCFDTGDPHCGPSSPLPNAS